MHRPRCPSGPETTTPGRKLVYGAMVALGLAGLVGGAELMVQGAVAFAEWLFEAVPWWTILAGNLLAALVMMGYFFRGHRVAWSEFLHARR